MHVIFPHKWLWLCWVGLFKHAYYRALPLMYDCDSAGMDTQYSIMPVILLQGWEFTLLLFCSCRSFKKSDGNESLLSLFNLLSLSKNERFTWKTLERIPNPVLPSWVIVILLGWLTQFWLLSGTHGWLSWYYLFNHACYLPLMGDCVGITYSIMHVIFPSWVIVLVLLSQSCLLSYPHGW